MEFIFSEFATGRPALIADIGRTNEKLLVKYDPRDLSLVYL